MRVANALRAVVFVLAAGYLIFTQDHSVATGVTALEFAGTAILLAGSAVMLIPGVKVPVTILGLPVMAAGLTLLVIVSSNSLADYGSDKLLMFRVLVAVFVAGNALNEGWLSIKAQRSEQLELRISAGIGLLAMVLFLFVPLNDVNSVGFLSAYLAMSAVQRGIWIASPDKKD